MASGHTKSLLWEAYLSDQQKSRLRSSHSVAQFVGGDKASNQSFQISTNNGLELSLSKLRSKSPSQSTHKRRINSSKSSVHHIKYNPIQGGRTDLSSQHMTLKPMYASDSKQSTSAAGTTFRSSCIVVYDNKQLSIAAHIQAYSQKKSTKLHDSFIGKTRNARGGVSESGASRGKRGKSVLGQYILRDYYN